jgi:hypothetical protein
VPHDLVRDFATAMSASQPGGAARCHVALLASLAAAGDVRAIPQNFASTAGVRQPPPSPLLLREFWTAEGTPVGPYIAARVTWHLLEARNAPSSTTLVEAAALILRLPWLQYSMRQSGGYLALQMV